MKEKDALETQYYVLEYYLATLDEWRVSTGYYSNATPKLYKKRDATRIINDHFPGNWRMIPAQLYFKKQNSIPDDKHLKFLQIAKIFASMSHCVSHQVGAVFVKNGRILSTGINGTPQGYENCCEIFSGYDAVKDREEHKEFSDKYEIHSEQNAIIWAAREGISIEGSILYCTHQPCWHCLKMVIAAGVKEIYFLYEYDRINKDSSWWDFAKKNGVLIKKLDENI